MPSFVSFTVLFDSYEEILCLWHHPEVSSMFASSSYTVMVWEGKKHFFSFLSFSFVGMGTQLFVEKIGNYVQELQNRKLFGFKCQSRLKKKSSKIRKTTKRSF